MVTFNTSPMFSELPFGEQLTLWGMRSWVAACGCPTDADGMLLSRAFRLVGAAGAERDLIEFLTVLSAAAHSAVDIHAPAHAEISGDEHLLLGAIGAAQDDHRQELTAALSCWLPAAGIRLVAAPLRRYAAQLGARALMVRRRAVASGQTRVVTPRRGMLH